MSPAAGRIGWSGKARSIATAKQGLSVCQRMCLSFDVQCCDCGVDGMIERLSVGEGLMREMVGFEIGEWLPKHAPELNDIERVWFPSRPYNRVMRASSPTI